MQQIWMNLFNPKIYATSK